jgi:hypothetical protein
MEFMVPHEHSAKEAAEVKRRGQTRTMVGGGGSEKE